GALGSSLNGRVVATTTPPRSKFLLMVFLSWSRTGIRVWLFLVVFGNWCREFADADRHRDRSSVTRRGVGELWQLSLACEQVFDGAAADSALADAEAGARAQLERTQRLRLRRLGGLAKTAVADLFTAADDGRLAEPGRPAAADAVGRLDAVGEPGEDGPLALEGRVGSGCPGRVVPGEAPFGEAEVHPADPGEL